MKYIAIIASVSALARCALALYDHESEIAIYSLTTAVWSGLFAIQLIITKE